MKRNPSATLKIIPLGGLDAIGKNMTVFECGDDMLLVDAGLMFPDDDHPGIDLILPDYTYVLENEHKLRGIIITHGHDDDTGSLPYLMKDLSRKVRHLRYQDDPRLDRGQIQRTSRQGEAC